MWVCPQFLRLLLNEALIKFYPEYNLSQLSEEGLKNPAL